MATTIKLALERWEKAKDAKANEAVEVNLQLQKPPLDKMTTDLAVLENCEKLSLSTNNIERIYIPPTMKNLKILSLARNNIKSFAGIEVLADSLEQLWISYNFIEKLKGIEVMKKLRVLNMAYNLVKDWNEFMKLSVLNENLRELKFLGNPLVDSMDESVYRDDITTRLPFLKMLDGEPVV
jgi:dynein light chain 1